MKRVVEAEWLDALPANDASALGSRSDLDLLNRLMGHAGILCHLLDSSRRPEPPKRIVDLGAGDGTLMLRLASHFSHRWKRVEVVLVDCKPVVSEETLARFAMLGWSAESISVDVLDWLENSDSGLADIMMTNLFLHQFEDRQLARLLTLAALRTRLFVACEPRRAAIPLGMSKLVGLIGCNAVTRHDAPASVRAGFAGQEISALWAAKSGWQLQERPAHFFSHAFRAERIGSI